MDIAAVAAEVRRELKARADPRRREGERRYFKETIRNYGAGVPQCRAVAREIHRRYRAELTLEAALALAERLLAGGWHEEGTVGLTIPERLRLPASGALLRTYGHWLRAYVGNWAHCDHLCTSLIGAVLIERPPLAARLMPWTGSRNRWLRRGAAVSLVKPARRGLFLKEALAMAGALLEDSDDLVQKGYGWLLKEAATQHRPQVTAFLARHAARMPRTALRYAIEKFPANECKRLMAL